MVATNSEFGQVDAFLAAKRLDALFDEGLISLAEKLDWDARLDRREVGPAEVDALFARLWPPAKA